VSPDLRIQTGYAHAASGAEIYFESAGAGPAVVFIHAGVADCRMWDPQFEAFADRFRLIRYDLRGFGKSRMRDGPYSLRDDLLSVLEHLGVAKAALVGCSMGGATAIDFTLEHPEMVTALVPVGAGVSGSTEWSKESIDHFGALMSHFQNGELDRARDLDARFWIDGPSRDPARIDADYSARARRLHSENFSVERSLHPEQELKPPAAGRLGEIKAPTMVVIGDCDAQDLIKLAHRMKAEIAGAKIATIANAAHLPSLEHPPQFNRLLLDFLGPLLG
jgi:pimeloyl-ACP methyl ester carboxylesterase